MYNHRCGGRALREGWKPDADSGLYPSDNYNCSTYMLTAKHSEQKCCSHYITTRAVRALLLDTIKTVSTYAISDEKGFVEKIRAASQLRQDNAAKELKRKLNRDRKRSAELDGLIKKLYESFATGSLTEKRFKLLSDGYEQEQEELDAAIVREQAELDAFNADTDRAGQFLDLVKRYTDFSVLTTPMIFEFVDKIVVHAPDRSNVERMQEVDIAQLQIKELDECAKLLRYTSNNVNQIARRVNSGGGVYADEVDEITAKLAEANGLFGNILEQLSKIK